MKASASLETPTPDATGPTAPSSRALRVGVARKPLGELAVDAVVVGLAAGEKRFPESVAALDRRAGGLVKSALEVEKFAGKVGTVTHVYAGDRLASPRL